MRNCHKVVVSCTTAYCVWKRIRWKRDDWLTDTRGIIMADGRKRWLTRGHAAAALTLGVILVINGGISGGGMVSEAKETGTAVTAQKKGTTASDEQEVIEFAIAYREAFSPEGIDTLADYVDNPEDEDFQMDLLRNKAMVKLGFLKGWENVKAIAKPMSDGKHWVASVSGDLLMDDLDYGVPGLNVVLVERNEKDELKVVIDDNAEESDAFLKEIREICLSDEIVEHSNEIAVAYNGLLAEHPELVELLESVQMKIEEELGEMLKEQFPVKTKTDSEQQKSGANIDSYSVQKGDCLWHIAEDQLGDGMRWSELYEKNREIIGENPDLLYVGITLQLN